VDVQFAKVPAKGEMLFRRQMLIAEEDDQILRQRAMDFVHLPVRQRPGEIGAADLGANDRCVFVDADRLVRRRLIGAVPVTGAIVAAQGAHR